MSCLRLSGTMQSIQPIHTDLVLIGGGHSHAIVLRMWGMNPLPGVRLTLITDVSEAPYSGMLPGHVAGLYRHEDCHINLRSLANFAGATLILDRAIGLDLTQQRVICKDHASIAFDFLSIDIGSTPKLPIVLQPGMIPAKPVPQFLHWWNQVLATPERTWEIAIVGGGLGGVELALNMQQRLPAIALHLIHQGAELAPSQNAWVRQHLRQQLEERQVSLYFNETVNGFEAGKLICQSGLSLACDAAVWVTQATAPAWLQQSGLSTCDRGFVQVNACLQSISHPSIFATGDIATIVHQPRPKAGVFAVRQGKPLFRNLQHIIRQQPLESHRPQAQYLSLIGLGNQTAIAARGNWGSSAACLWNWKDWIDRRFMQRFQNLPEMRSSTWISILRDQFGNPIDRPFNSPSTTELDFNPQEFAMRCLGCGAKVGSTTLTQALQRVRSESANSECASLQGTSSDSAQNWSTSAVLLGLEQPDDAAVIQVPTDRLLVQTVDYLPALVSDPFLFGQIATNHALSDLFAMGATPHSVLAIATLPYATEKKQEETLYQLLAGTLKQLQETQTQLIGGHTIEGTTLSFGLACNGWIEPHRILKKAGMQPGDRLILTKPLGTGVLFAADMRRQARATWIDAAIAMMLQSNYRAAQIFLTHEATACTDVTGFGLAGHLVEMVKASQITQNLTITLQIHEIPVLPGVLSSIAQGIVSSLHPQNLKAQTWIDRTPEADFSPEQFTLLFDPQTSGGLLATVPSDHAAACLKALQQADYPAQMIGQVTCLEMPAQPIRITD
ncbi:MAG: selenide, water dikinase SelD [Synechococcales bacterium]|nr:selenide, water dikinase SelD [Synechococcales bacterium]